ncbi:hypothetical protein Agub_g7849, partial [Astrephomene gubernaculifera]
MCPNTTQHMHNPLLRLSMSRHAAILPAPLPHPPPTPFLLGSSASPPLPPSPLPTPSTALGVVLWEMWHGRPCYQRVRGVKQFVHASGFPSFPSHCPPLYADVAARCMRRSPEERPPLGEVHDLIRQLLSVATGGGSAASTMGPSSDGGATSGVISYEWPFVVNVNAGYNSGNNGNGGNGASYGVVGLQQEDSIGGTGGTAGG